MDWLTDKVNCRLASIPKLFYEWITKKSIFLHVNKIQIVAKPGSMSKYRDDIISIYMFEVYIVSVMTII